MNQAILQVSTYFIFVAVVERDQEVETEKEKETGRGIEIGIGIGTEIEIEGGLVQDLQKEGRLDLIDHMSNDYVTVVEEIEKEIKKENEEEEMKKDKEKEIERNFWILLVKYTCQVHLLISI